MRRFESSRPSHAFREFADFAACGAEPRIPRAFAGAEIGDRQNRACLGGFVCSVSNADFPISGIARQGAGETGLLFLETGSHSGGYGGPRRRGALAVARLNSGSRGTGQSRPSCSSCSVQVSGRLRASRVTVRSAGARCSAMACNEERRGRLRLRPPNSGWRGAGQPRPSFSSCSAQVSGRLRASRVTVRSPGARPSAMA
jgi:hypothetical protein